MKGKSSGISVLVASACICLSMMPVMASPEEDAAVQLYKDGKYGPALAAFEAADKKQPRKPLTHYYIALCCQALNQVARAAQEYKWVADNCGPGSLKTAALKGIDSVQRYKSGRDSQVAASAANAEAAAAKKATDAAPGTTATTGKAAKPGDKATAAAPAKPGDSKVKKVLAFAQSWDRQFLAFESAFEATKSKYAGKIAISRVDPDDEANSALKTKYNVSSIPSIVYLDDKGAVLKTESGIPSDGDAFAAEIESLNKKK
jgi:thioredoxin-like negative regulator of GroEL